MRISGWYCFCAALKGTHPVKQSSIQNLELGNIILNKMVNTIILELVLFA